jgi:hypothetical protein
MLRGDYATAERVLRLLAEDTANPDPVAQFFMASLYFAGLGVAPNWIRACGLYLSAAVPTNPFASQSRVLAQRIHLDNPAMYDQCSAASVGTWRDPTPASFQVLSASVADGQTTTADGVDAYLGGDYRRAAEILKPKAEGWPPEDHVAEFFMATLYDSGSYADPVRACALYGRASMAHTSPLGRQAEALMGALRESMTEEAFDECLVLATVGFNHGFQPVIFALEADHWVRLDLKGATIGSAGTEKRLDLALVRPGSVFLRADHTELSTGPKADVRRHFVELFMWWPGRTAGTWSLGWQVLEVTRTNIETVAVQELRTVAAKQAPAAPPDLRSLVCLRVDRWGNAEWAVLSGPQPESGLIESEADKRERTDERRAREAADARVDWTRVRDSQRTPELTYAGADGCADLFVYGWSADRTEVISIRADTDLLGLSTAPRTLDLATPHPYLEVLVHVFDRPQRSPFCTDVRDNSAMARVWRPARGTVTIELSPRGVRPATPPAYRAIIQVNGAEFVSDAGVRVAHARPIALTALVGQGGRY